jgi:hypothetical protein
MGPELENPSALILSTDTHFGQVLNQMGPPHKISALPAGFVFLYEYFAPSERLVGGKIPIEEFEKYNPFKMDVGRGLARRQTLLFFFNQEGRLLQRHQVKEKEALGKGLRLSFLTSYGNLIDTSYIGHGTGPNQWGVSLLKPLKKALNRQQDLDTGLSGVEQIGTPAKMGQRSLEFN